MDEQVYTYIIVGAGLAGASAVAGIRELDTSGSILLLGDENHLPYDRPPLSKKLWFGKKKVNEIFVHDQQFYTKNNVTIKLGTRITGIDPNQKMVIDSSKNQYKYKKLLLTTGGIPRLLSIPGGKLDGICYFRYLDDYTRIRKLADAEKSAVIIGGGFIGSEIAAALNINKLDVTMIFPSKYLCDRVFPEYLCEAVQQDYRTRGVKILAQDAPESFTKNGAKYITRTKKGNQLESDILIVGIGIAPSINIAASAGLKTGNGIEVNEELETSIPDIYAAGDNALFPYQALGKPMRVEHWDNALNQGKWAGRNSAGAREPYTYMPYFFSDLFDFGYEAVGEVDVSLETFADWQKENQTGVIYYLKDNKVRGVMLCNVWEKIDVARDLIRKGERVTPDMLRGRIRP